ncbi:hypothetical protein OG598_08510 [Micromonospora sp. NBC_00330]|uniref:hypothetical protein n=1 Tax=Micromonospora sp. NBC_00330 TaxID=2903585 RepID=UPI002E2D6713|nr:hypothetical protein [Micromonospora sp. NBC_00330]
MSQADAATLAYWGEHREQLRQSENQRAVLTNYLLAITAALSGLIAQQKFAVTTLPLSILITLSGLFGALATAKYHERAEYHLQQARALTQVLKEDSLLARGDDLTRQYREAHYRKHPRLHRIRLHRLWTGLHCGIAVYGMGLTITTLL